MKIVLAIICGFAFLIIFRYGIELLAKIVDKYPRTAMALFAGFTFSMFFYILFSKCG